MKLDGLTDKERAFREKILSISVTGTRDSFGVGSEFYDKKTGKVIDNWKTWNEAGYRDPVKDGMLDDQPDVKAGVKRKIEKCEKYDTKKKFSVMTGGK
jgi:hypothetical protein